jgi:hypothetical protein
VSDFKRALFIGKSVYYLEFILFIVFISSSLSSLTLFPVTLPPPPTLHMRRQDPSLFSDQREVNILETRQGLILDLLWTVMTGVKCQLEIIYLYQLFK